MRVSSLLVVILVLLLPVPVHAQSVKLVDLIGTWQKDDSIPYFLSIRADSTYCSFSPSLHPHEKGIFRRWNYLKGDTISFVSDKELRENGVPELRGEPGHKITLKGQQLTFTALGPAYAMNGTHKYKRDTSTSNSC